MAKKKPVKAQKRALLTVQAEAEALLAEATPRMIERLIARFDEVDDDGNPVMSVKEQTIVVSLAMRTLAVREATAKKLGLSRYASGGKVREITNNNFFAGQAMTPEAIAKFVTALHQPGGGALPAPKVIDVEPNGV